MKISLTNSTHRSNDLIGDVALSLSILLTPAASFAQSAQHVCPKGYSIFESVCIDEITGDVVNQSRTNGAAGAPSPASGPNTASDPAKSGG